MKPTVYFTLCLLSLWLGCSENDNTEITPSCITEKINAIKKKKTFGIPRQKSIAINIKGKVFTFSLNIVVIFSVNCMRMTAP